MTVAEGARDAALDSIHGRMILGILAAAQSLGFDMRQLAAAAGLDAIRLAQDPDASVPAIQAVVIWEELEKRSNDPFIGVRIASRIPLGVLGFVYHSLNASDTLRAAAHRAMRYQRLVAGPLRTTLLEQGDDAVFRLETQGSFAERDAAYVNGRSVLPFATEQHVLLLSYRALASVVGGELVPRRVSFARTAIGDPAVLSEAFRAPVSFDPASPTTVVLARADLDRPVPSGDPQLARWLDAQAEQRLAAQESSDVLVRMRMAVKIALSQGEPRLEQVATLMRMSPRTLQRKVQSLDTTFAGEVDAVRKDVALGLMGDKLRAVAEVAFLVGYTELSAFYRAFRRWTGVTPVDWRNGVRA